MKFKVGHKSTSTMGVGKLRGFNVEDDFGLGNLLVLDISTNSFSCWCLLDSPQPHQQCHKGPYQ